MSNDQNNRKKNPFAQPREFISRAARIPVLGLHNVQFSIHLPDVDVFNFGLKNLSTTGLGFDPCGQEDIFTEGEILNAKIHLGGQCCSFNIAIRYATPNIIGCHVEDHAFDYQKIVSNYFKEELMALEMKQIDSKLLKEDSEGEPILFFGGPHCSLYYVVKDNSPVKFKINFMGNTLHSAPDGKMIFNYGDEQDQDELNIELELFDLPEETLEHMIRFVQSIPGVPQEHEDWLVSYIRHSKSSKDYPQAA